VNAIIVIDPVKTPPEPIPPIALPMINTVLLDETPHTTDPPINNIIFKIKTLLTAKIWYALPQLGASAVTVIRYAELYQPISERE
jgi:hypothetical protein